MAWVGRAVGIGGAVLLALAPAVLPARESLGVFEGWGAFRDDRPARCFAIAEPVGRRRAEWRPFMAVSVWPLLGIHRQLHVRLRARKQVGAPIVLAVGERRFRLVAGGADAWAPDVRADAAIVTAMRSATSASVETMARDGGRALVDVYPLRGAATAIDAATLACARR